MDGSERERKRRRLLTILFHRNRFRDPSARTDDAGRSFNPVPSVPSFSPFLSGRPSIPSHVESTIMAAPKRKEKPLNSLIAGTISGAVEGFGKYPYRAAKLCDD